MSNTALARVPELRERIRQMQTTKLDTRSLPTHPVIGRLLPGGALQEGATYSVDRSLTLLMLLLAIVSLVRPTILAWACLMVGSVGNLAFLFWSLNNSWHGSPTLGQWILFTVIGLLPAMALWRHRPHSRDEDQ